MSFVKKKAPKPVVEAPIVKEAPDAPVSYGEPIDPLPTTRVDCAFAMQEKLKEIAALKAKVDEAQRELNTLIQRYNRLR